MIVIVCENMCDCVKIEASPALSQQVARQGSHAVSAPAPNLAAAHVPQHVLSADPNNHLVQGEGGGIGNKQDSPLPMVQVAGPERRLGKHRVCVRVLGAGDQYKLRPSPCLACCST